MMFSPYRIDPDREHDRAFWDVPDLRVRTALSEVWQRLPTEARRALYDVKCYSVPDLHTADGRPAYGLANRTNGERWIKIRTNHGLSHKALCSVVAHEWAHIYRRDYESYEAKAIKEAGVHAQLRAWGLDDGRSEIGD